MKPLRLISKTRFVVSISVVLIIIASVVYINKISAINETKDSEVKTINTISTTSNIEELTAEIIPIKQEVEPQKTYYNVPLPEELQDYIKEMCEKYDVDMATILSVIKTESLFKHEVKSSNLSEKGYSIGLMQLNENYIDWYGELTGLDEEFDINNIYHNIEGGIAIWKFYKSYWEKKGLTGDKLLIYTSNAYNMGIVGFKKYIKNTGQISRSYDRKVMRYKKELTTITK
jgi:hypothetical protein